VEEGVGTLVVAAAQLRELVGEVDWDKEENQ
jgi:hypothetical protein